MPRSILKQTKKHLAKITKIKVTFKITNAESTLKVNWKQQISCGSLEDNLQTGFLSFYHLGHGN